jgi:hypothetical protein
MGKMRVVLFLVFAIAALEAPAALAQAQQGGACASISSDAERLMCYDRERCAAIASDSERLACYDRVQRAFAPATIPAPTAIAPAAAAANGPGAAAPAAAASGAGAGAAAGTSSAQGTAAGTEPQSGQVSPQASTATESAPLATRPRDPAATAPPAPIAPGAATPVQPAIVPIVVVGTRALPGRPVEFVTENGQVWVQTDSQRTQLPHTPFNAQLKPGAMGSTFLVPADRRAIRVRLRD